MDQLFGRQIARLLVSSATEAKEEEEPVAQKTRVTNNGWLQPLSRLQIALRSGFWQEAREIICSGQFRYAKLEEADLERLETLRRQ